MSFVWGGINHFGLNILIGQLNAAGAEYRSTVLGLNSAVTYFAVFVTTGIFGKVFVDFGFAYVALGGVILLLPAVTYLILGAKAVRA
jgi:predicted MFS family arabinose efflux permease